MMSVHRTRLTVLGFFVAIRLICSQEVEVEVVDVDANKWDLVTCGPEDGNGCAPELTVDGFLNNVDESRWSCQLKLLPDGPCYITFDLGVPYILSRLDMYFLSSNNSGRHSNEFNVSLSNDSETFVTVMSVASTIPLPLQVADEFTFDPGDVGRLVRITDTLDNKWLSVNEVKFFANGTAPTPGPVVQTPSPSILPTPAPTKASTPVPSPAPMTDPSAGVQVTESPTSTTPSPTAAGTPAPGDGSSEYDYTGGGVGEDLDIVAITFGGGFVFLSLVAVGSIFLSRKALNPASTHPLEDSIKGDPT